MVSRHDAETSFIEGGGETEGDALKPGQPGYDPDAMLPFGPWALPEDRWFESKSLAARLFIMIAGVTMNVILTIVVVTSLMYKTGQTVVPTTIVGEVDVPASIPALSQIHTGDTIRLVNGT